MDALKGHQPNSGSLSRVSNSSHTPTAHTEPAVFFCWQLLQFSCLGGNALSFLSSEHKPEINLNVPKPKYLNQHSNCAAGSHRAPAPPSSVTQDQNHMVLKIATVVWERIEDKMLLMLSEDK